MTVTNKFFKGAFTLCATVLGLSLAASSASAVVLYSDASTDLSSSNSLPAWDYVGSTVSSDSVWVAFSLSYTGSGIDDAEKALFCFGNTTGPQLGVVGNENIGTSADDLMLTSSASNAGLGFGGSWVSGSDLTSGDSIFVVAELSKSVSGSAELYDTFELWVNPSAGAFGAPSASYTGSGEISSFSWVGFRSEGLTDDVFSFDDLVIASSLSDIEIMAVPEPSTWALGIGFLAIAGFIYRRRK